jgi:nickel transport protein
MRRRVLLFVILLAPGPASGHYNMLFPSAAAVKKGEVVEFTYQWGHPFEHELFDAPKPEKVNVLFPDLMTHKDLTSSLQSFKQAGADGKDVACWKFNFTPSQRGDHSFFLATPPIWLDADKEFVQDIVRVNLHVQTQNGWEADPGDGFRIIPLTRPYGLLSGMTFQGRVRRGGDGMEEVSPLVEIERYNPAPPKDLPAEELITFTTRYDPNGVFTFAFPEAGWWGFTAQRSGGAQQRKGKDYPLRQRLTLWIPVEAKK